MRRSRAVAVLGIALGTALGAAVAAGPVAGADPIDDAWPYNVHGLAIPPGVTGPTTNFQELNLGLLDLSQYDRTMLNSVGDDWYSEHVNAVSIPLLASYDHQVVQSILDASAGYPHVGTVLDDFQLLPSLSFPVVGTVPLESTSLDDPAVGFANETSVYFFMSNLYISDAAGMKDVVDFFGQTFTLFEIPFSAPEAGDAAASGLDDGFQQLLTEFSNAFPGVDALLNLA